MIGNSKLFEQLSAESNIIRLSDLKNQTIIIRYGKYYGCVKDYNGNTIKKGFETREEARLWINDKVEYESRWTE